MEYNNFSYIYPPRPESKTCWQNLHKFDNSEFVAQPKYNGTCCIVFTNGVNLKVYNRHRQELTKWDKNIDFHKLANNGKWVVMCGEYLNKGLNGESGLKEVDKFILWDCLVFDGIYLVGETLEKRLSILEDFLPCHRAVVGNKIEMYNHICITNLKGIYKAPTYLNNFEQLYQDVIKTDLYEGVVLKKINSKLSFGLNKKNNTEWQIKIRKPTKIYNF